MNVRAIEYIQHPDKDVQLEAIKQDWQTIQFISNPDKDVQLEAIKQDWKAIKFISNPDKDVQKEAIMQNICAFEYIKGLDIQYRNMEIYTGCNCSIKNNYAPQPRSQLTCAERSETMQHCTGTSNL